MVITFPNNKRVEDNVIGSLISSEKVLVNNIRFLEEDCFYDNKNKNIFKSILSLFKDNKSVDLMSVHAQLKKDGHNIEYGELVDLSGNTENYRVSEKCLVLKEYAIRRNLIISCNEISKKSFDESEDVLETLEQSSKTIDNICLQSFILINEYLNLDTEFILSSEIDYNRSASSVEKINEISSQFNSKEILFPSGSRQLYNISDFPNFKTSSIVTNFTPYNQFTKQFVPSLSMLDILMFNNKNTIRYLLNDFKKYSLDEE